jgi:hypothetical protein
MGTTYGLDVFEPAIFERTAELFSKDVSTIVTEAKRVVQDKYLLENLDELPDEDDGRADILNNAFLEMARAQSWDLDKCFRAGLDEAFRSVPMFLPLKRKFLDFAEGDVTLPQSITRAEGGLYIVWSSRAIQDCMVAVDRLKAPSDVAGIIADSPFSFVQKISGGVARARSALEKVPNDDYLWRHWQSFREALSQAAKGKHLGFSMYP